MAIFKKNNKLRIFNIMKEKKIISGLYSIERRLKLKFFILFLLISKFQSQKIMKLNDSTVKIKISGSGNLFILNNQFTPKPNKVYIDNDSQKDISYSYNLNENNVVKLVWNQPLTSCKSMFKSCVSIVEIKFFNFDTSQCNDMSSMFSSCTILKSLDLSSFVTSKVTTFSDMFASCYSLASIDVSNFDTTNALNMEHMFSYCYGLKSIDLSSFNTQKVNYLDNMFSNCVNIESINFSNFDTTNSINKDDMFLRCNKLKYLNIKKYKTNKILDDNFFKGTDTNLIITIEKKDLFNIFIFNSKIECVIY